MREQPTLVRADLHNYGQTSNLISGGFDRIVAKAKERLGRGGVVGIVDVHEERYSRFRKNTPASQYEDLQHGVYFPNDNVLVLRGVRTFTPDDSMSILAFGIPEGKYLRRDEVSHMVKEAREEYDAVIIALQSQNLFKYLVRNPSLLEQIDAIEVFNGNYSIIPSSNQEAQLFWEFYRNKTENNLCSIVTSGGHSVSEIGLSWMMMPMLDLYSPGSLKESLAGGVKRERIREEENRTNSLFAKAMAFRHGLAVKYWWAKRAKEREVIDGIAQ